MGVPHTPKIANHGSGRSAGNGPKTPANVGLAKKPGNDARFRLTPAGDQTALTSSACRPFWPCITLKLTF